jgi:hypothetical protein
MGEAVAKCAEERKASVRKSDERDWICMMGVIERDWDIRCERRYDERSRWTWIWM